MAKAGNLVSARSFNSICAPSYYRTDAAKARSLKVPSQIQTSNVSASTKSLKVPSQIQTSNVSASTKRKDQSPLIGKTTCRSPRRLITISTSDGRWHGDWSCDYLVSLQDLQLIDLVEVEDKTHENAKIFINLNIQKHASFGLSVDGRIITSFTRKCSSCSSPYCRQINTQFKVWVLLASKDNRKIQLPEIGGDPSVIYVKPGYEADLDSLVQDAIRLATSVKDTCSELCEKTEVQYVAGQNTASMDKRWSKLLELKKQKL